MVKIQPCCKASASETQVRQVQMLERGGGREGDGSKRLTLLTHLSKPLKSKQLASSSSS